MKLILIAFAAMLFASATQAQSMKDSTSFADYYGKYKFDAGSPIDEATILWKDTSVVISTGMGDATMGWLGTDSFSMSYENGTITFKRGDDKKIASLEITVSGTVLDGKKEAPGAGGTAFRREDLINEKKAVAVK